jgi:hypothetical protein
METTKSKAEIRGREKLSVELQVHELAQSGGESVVANRLIPHISTLS